MPQLEEGSDYASPLAPTTESKCKVTPGRGPRSSLVLGGSPYMTGGLCLTRCSDAVKAGFISNLRSTDIFNATLVFIVDLQR